MSSQFSIQYRPFKFADVIGHAKIIKEIKIHLKNDTFPQASLFSGLTGTGKTTLAQITAMSLNCTGERKSGDVEPCGECVSCRDVITGSFTRGTELHDATKMGKDEVIKLANDSKSNPMYSKHRVYIIDEADQLSSQAKAVFLKLLEVPSKYNYFMLLSMEDKIPTAIKNRCQLYNFPPMPQSELVTLMQAIARKEGVFETFFTEELGVVRAEMVYSIAKNCNGSVRQALQYFERCLTGEYTDRLEMEKEFGFMSDDIAIGILKGLLKRETSSLIAIAKFTEKEAFYNIAWSVINKVVTYHITGWVASEWERNQYAVFSKKNAMLLSDLFKDIWQNSAYFKEAYFMIKMQEYFLTDLTTGEIGVGKADIPEVTEEKPKREPIKREPIKREKL